MRRNAAGLLAAALAVGACGTTGTAPDPSAVAAARVGDCVKAHGLAGSSDRVDPPAPTVRGESTTVFRSCEGGSYVEIRVTRIPWPEKAEVTNASAPDRIESPCAEVELRYTFAKQSSPALQAPIRVTAGARMLITGQDFTDALPFRAATSDSVVVHNLSYSIASARCVS